MKTGIQLIAEEREEQIKKHYRTVEGDVYFNNHYQLSEAASLLVWVNPEDVSAEYGANDNMVFTHCCPVNWDENIWNNMMNKPYIERLKIAGALLAAEIDRLSAK